MASIAIAILFFEKLDQTIECVNSVIHSGCTIYILSNGSSLKSYNQLKAIFRDNENVFIFKSESNVGPSRGRNILIDKISEQWILFLDNDILVHSHNWHKIMLDSISAYKDVDVFIPRVFNKHEKTFLKFHLFKIKGQKVVGDFPNDDIVNCFPAGASCINKDLFIRVGKYSENIRVLEDFELSIRALVNKQIIRCKLINDITLIHDHRYSNIKVDKLAIAEPYNLTHYSIAEEFIKHQHNIIFYSGWQTWVSAQLELFKNESVLTFLKQKTKTVMKIIFKYIS
jgi:GT2 family glycosyltransferase